MRKIFISVFAFFLFCILFSTSSFAAGERYASCDACGFFPIIQNGDSPICTATKQDPNDATKTINLWPGDWERCATCLYPSLYPSGATTPPNCDTLLVNEDNSPVNEVMAGRQFTMLGCITSGTEVGFFSPTGASSFVQKLLDVIFALAGGFAFLYLMYGGFIILTSQADPEKLNYGRRLIYGAIVGLIITLASVFIVNIIGSGFLKIPGFSGTL